MASLRKILNKLLHKRKDALQERYPQYQIGRETYGKPRIHSWGEGANLKIGAFCSFAKDVHIFLGGEHRTDWVTTYPFNTLWKAGSHIKGHPKTKGDVVIGNDVWIGEGAIIMSGVVIGDGAVIGARAVIAKDVLPYAIAVGNPARIIRKRFDEKTIQRLLSIRWWDWSDDRIERALPLLLSDKIEDFLAAAEENKV